MTRGRSNKAWQVGWRKNNKSCKHFPFIQCYLNLEDLGLSKILPGISNNILNTD